MSNRGCGGHGQPQITAETEYRFTQKTQEPMSGFNNTLADAATGFVSGIGVP
jgi:hypothetical protein